MKTSIENIYGYRVTRTPRAKPYKAPRLKLRNVTGWGDITLIPAKPRKPVTGLRREQVAKKRKAQRKQPKTYLRRYRQLRRAKLASV